MSGLQSHVLPATMLLATLFLCAEAAYGDIEWKTIVFGQSIGADKNSVTVDTQANSVTVTAGVKDGSTAGGKVASSHDGISYYYTEIDPTVNFILSAKVKVNFFAKEKPDNQEAFGIMARDAIGKNLDSSVFASNMVLVGGYRGAVQSVFRNNVNDSSGAGAVMENVFKFGDRPANDGTAVYTLRLRKTNTGYHASVDGSQEAVYYRPKQLEILDKSKIYVGFFAARVASITVTDISITTSDAATDPAGESEPAKKIAASVTILSLTASSSPDYDLILSTNLAGKLVIMQGKTESTREVAAPGVVTERFTIVGGENLFEIRFVPEASANADPVTLKHAVTYKTYGKGGDTIFAAPNGKDTATGTAKDPIDIHTAVRFVRPGQTVMLADGVYAMDRPLVIEKGNDGEKGKLKVLKGSDKVLLDFGKKYQGFSILGNRWKIFGIRVTGAAAAGIRVSGNYNILEQVKTYANGDTGLQISGSSTDKIDAWPSRNLVLNCESYDNRDASENNADGFAAKLTCGTGNVFRGCVAHNNCDDGWDLYSKLETGPIGAVVVENCIAYGNGIMSDGTRTKGDGNGFKLGGEGLAVKHVLRNSLSYGNRTAGISNNSDPAITVENNTSVDNGGPNFVFSVYTGAQPQFTVRNNVSFRTTDGPDDTIIETLAGADNYFIKDKASVNGEGKRLSKADFKSVKTETIKRGADGKISAVSFMAPQSKATGGARLDDYSRITVIEDK